jgi:hypothetical protein
MLVETLLTMKITPFSETKMGTNFRIYWFRYKDILLQEDIVKLYVYSYIVYLHVLTRGNTS